MIDWTQWPVLLVQASGMSADEARQETVRALDEALARDEAFAVVLEMPPRQSGTVRDRVGQVRMIKRLRPGLAARCRGLAFVLAAEAQHEHAKLLRSGAKVWGCPVHADTDPDGARAWARQRLAAGGGR
jgi:hypothetical protein